MSFHTLRLFFGLVPLVTLLAQQALPAAALVLQERQSQEPTLLGNLTQDVLQVASAISPPCANTDSCINLVTLVIPDCEGRGGDPGCWCANHDALHDCAMCIISSTNNQTTANQTEAAAAGHSGFHVACDAYAEIVNGTNASLASNATADPIDPEVWNAKNIRPDGTVLIVHSNKDLASGLGKKINFSWSFGRIGISFNFDTDSLEFSGSIGVRIPWLGYKTLASFSGNLRGPVGISWSKFGIGGSLTCFLREDGLWMRLVLLGINREFKIFSFCKANVYRIYWLTH
ncbi:hypothetical protein BDV93DRAFT_512593 [Ceratobasidium sp. AG-I]|nr:hypothetical protein BDV93DRAFT_512593 [Ceratobasidium sp. AG-I]